MKQFFTFLLILFSINSFSQIDPGWYGLMPEDSCNFETTNSRFTIDSSNANNDWVIGSTNKPFFGQANSLPNAIMTDSLSPYSSNNLSYFDIGFDLNTDWWLMMNLYIQFDHKYETDTLIDGGFITVSYDTGQTWINVIDDTCDCCWNYPNINSQNLYSHSDTLMNGNFGFSGTADWTTTTLQWIFNIPVKQQILDTFIIRFNFISDSIQTNKDGWIIDNIYLGDIYQGNSINELSDKTKVNLYPNLTHTHFNYTVETNEPITSLNISSINGKVLLTIDYPKQKDQIDVSCLPPGNYFVKFTTQKGAIVKRLIKN